MSKTATVLAIDRILEHVPVPFIAQAAQGLDDVLTLIEAQHGIDLSDLKGQLAAAREPWQRIHDTAVQQGGRDLTGTTFGGSTGE